MDFYKRYNLTILAIPAYYIFAVLPHMYAINVATQHRPLDWDNRAPRSSDHKVAIKESISEEAYGKYERAEGAHANALEQLPLFATAVIVGNAAGLPRNGWFGLDAFVGAFFAVRALHTVSYIAGSTKQAAWVKTGVWAASLGMLFTVFGKAAKVLNRAAI
jgi:uncharacterized MAPEG superfamily protein